MHIEALYSLFAGRDCYAVGTGPSARCFPWDFLIGKPTLGLNQAYRYAPMDVSLTVHPELVQAYLRDGGGHPTWWAVKRKPPMAHLTTDDPNYYVFDTKEEWGLFAKPEPGVLFCGRGVQQTALDLLSRAGARSITLVGVDMGELGGDHHGHAQHVRFHGLPPQDVYREYRVWTAKARRLVRRHRKIPVLSLSPLMGVHPDEDYERLCEELDLPKLPSPQDTSRYNRKGVDL